MKPEKQRKIDSFMRWCKAHKIVYNRLSDTHFRVIMPDTEYDIWPSTSAWKQVHGRPHHGGEALAQRLLESV